MNPRRRRVQRRNRMARNMIPIIVEAFKALRGMVGLRARVREEKRARRT